jgi:hypothetical protein
LSGLDESVLALPLPDPIFGFHAQQACEKLLKALVSAKQIRYPFTHSLEKLLKLLAESGETLPALPHNPLLLEPFAVTFRYEFVDPFDEAMRQTMRLSVALLREFVLERILTLEQ